MFGTDGFTLDDAPGGPHPGVMPHVETAAAGEMCKSVLCPVVCSLPVFCMTYVLCVHRLVFYRVARGSKVIRGTLRAGGTCRKFIILAHLSVTD
jgi:hypothetical protein